MVAQGKLLSSPLIMPKSMVPTEVAGNAQAHEDKHVHMIYDKIATHFSSTRYKVSLSISRSLISNDLSWNRSSRGR